MKVGLFGAIKPKRYGHGYLTEFNPKLSGLGRNKEVQLFIAGLVFVTTLWGFVEFSQRASSFEWILLLVGTVFTVFATVSFGRAANDLWVFEYCQRTDALIRRQWVNLSLFLLLVFFMYEFYGWGDAMKPSALRVASSPVPAIVAVLWVVVLFGMLILAIRSMLNAKALGKAETEFEPHCVEFHCDDEGTGDSVVVFTSDVRRSSDGFVYTFQPMAFEIVASILSLSIVHQVWFLTVDSPEYYLLLVAFNGLLLRLMVELHLLEVKRDMLERVSCMQNRLSYLRDIEALHSPFSQETYFDKMRANACDETINSRLTDRFNGQ